MSDYSPDSLLLSCGDIRSLSITICLSAVKLHISSLESAINRANILKKIALFYYASCTFRNRWNDTTFANSIKDVMHLQFSGNNFELTLIHLSLSFSRF